MAELLIIGVDEVGRGCLAGPVAACAYVFHSGLQGQVAGLRDSKKLSARQREALRAQLTASGRHGYGQATNVEIDSLGIVAANHLAMRRAIENLGITNLENYAIVVDGNILPPFEDLRAGRLECIVKADDTVPAVSAASVLAKLQRDQHMAEAAVAYPGYGFESHVGYGTKAHLEAITKLGPCPLHRLTFAPLTPKIKREAKRRPAKEISS